MAASTSTVSNGVSTSSMFNTPQASDDTFALTEGAGPTLSYFNVMANDSGGNAKTLYSLTAGQESQVAVNDADGQWADLTTLDTQGTVSGGALTAGYENSELGAHVAIVNGKIAYDTSSITAQINALGAGEQLVDHITYAIRLGNGTLSMATATIVITGTNDDPTISLADDAGAVTEDTDEVADDPNTPAVETGSFLSDTGSITFDDVDLTDTHTTTVTGDAGNSLGGTLTAVVSDAATGAGDGTVDWTYSVANSATQYLAEGETATETFTVKIEDNNGGFVEQTVTVTVTGTNDDPTISLADDAGAVTEDTDEVADDPNTPAVETGSFLSDTGSITFDDVDLTDTHTTTVTGDAGNSLGGTLTAVVSDAATGAGDGTVDWTYSVANSATQYLAEGETATETFTVKIEDNNGGFVEQTVTVTVTGTNDDPTISLADDAGAVTEDTDEVADDPNTPAVETGSFLSDTGSITFDDVDLTDTHTTTVTGDAGNSLGGTLTAVVSDAATGAGDGTVDWTYSVANSATQYLAEGETATETFTVKIEDNNGGFVEQTVTVTVTGTNDDPTISLADDAGAVTEDTDEVADDPNTPAVETGSFLSDTGSITFDDVDLTDTHTTTVTGDAGNSLGGTLTAVVSDAATGAGDGTVDWTYSVANSATQYLAEGETATETFTVKIEDNNGGFVEQTVTVTVTGTNDDPTISLADDAGAVTEDTDEVADDPNTPAVETGSFLSDTGSITFDDVDLTDTHTTTVTGDAGNSLGGTLTAVVSDAATGAGDGTVDWTYSVANSATQYLAEGETATETFTVKIEDNNGGFVEQTVTVTVTGTNDDPTISLADDAGAVTEDTDEVADDPNTPAVETGSFLSDTGSITFDDVDLTDTHTTTVTGDAGNSLGGTLTAVVSDAATGAGDGTVDWTYSVANSATQYLAEGETATETFTVKIEDNNGGFVEQTVTVTVTGTNDDPTISLADDAGAVTEDTDEVADDPNTPAVETGSFLSDTGSITFDDVDLTDTHTTTVTGDAGNSLGGTLTAVVSDAATGAGDGTVDWTYSVANSATQYLAEGETATETFTVKIEDNNGGFVEQTVTVTVTGTNDDPTISLADDAGAVTEDTDEVADDPNTPAVETGSFLSDTGSITFDDVDLTDTHTTTVTGDAGNSLGGTLTAVVSDAATGAGDGTVDWTYSVANSATQYLAEGETATETFTVKIEDNNGGFVEQTVTVTVTGTNDDPVISNLGPAASSTEQVFSALDTNVALSDVELDAENGGAGNYAGASVTISRNGAANAQDTFSFAANPNFTVSGNQLQAGGQTFATFTNTGGALTITFTSAATIATAALADSVVQSINYANSSDTPPATVTLDYTFSDGISSDTESLTVNITDVPDADPNDFDNATATPTGTTATGGDDILVGTSAGTTINLLGGNDTYYGAGGNDNVSGQNGNDTIYGQAGDDTINGNNGNDTIYGGSGNDNLTGNNDPDTIYGGSGNDTIDSGGANDLIIGGYGVDNLTGGGDNDTFQYLSIQDTGDTITDFRPLNDLSTTERDFIDFAAVYGGTLAVAGNTSTVQANSVNWSQSGADTVVQADVTGDAVADITITLQGVTATNVSANDFIL